MSVDDKLDRIIEEQHKQRSRIHVLGLGIKDNAEDLKEHMRRTEASEKRLDELEKYKYYVLGALFTASLLSSSVQEIASKIFSLLK